VIEVQFRRILAHNIRVAEQILAGLVKSGQMRATPADQCMIRILALRSRARGRPTPSIFSCRRASRTAFCAGRGGWTCEPEMTALR